MTWTAILTAVVALVGSAGLGGWLKTWLDHKAGKRAQTDNVALALVKELGSRVTKLEGDLVTERERCDVELRLLRHTKNRLLQTIYSLLHLFDVPARQRKELLAGVHAELSAIVAAEAIEKSAVLAATVSEGNGHE